MAYSKASGKDEATVEQAAKDVYAWLSRKDDAFRAYLQIFSGSGVVYAGQCEEKVMRAYATVGGADEQAFVNAARKRLCTEQGQRAGQNARDDKALTQR